MDFNEIIDRVPFLMQREKWLQYIASKNADFKSDYDALVELDKRITSIEGDLILAKRMKKKYLSDLIDVSEAFQNGKVEQSEVIRLKSKVDALNEEIDNLMHRLDVLPQELKEKNRTLGVKSIKWLYEVMVVDDKRFKELTDNITTVRAELSKMKDEKFELEELQRQRYKFIHGLLGKDIVDRLDQLVGIGEDER